MAEDRVQRRLAAILAADVVGYSRLMRDDEAGTYARLKALPADFLDPKVAEYGGRIVKTMGNGGRYLRPQEDIGQATRPRPWAYKTER